MKVRHLEQLFVGFIGTPKFCVSCTRSLQSLPSIPQHFVSQLSDGWHNILEQHPNLIIIEGTQGQDELTNGMIRDCLNQTRERFGNDIVIAVAITESEELLSAGHLLFGDGDSHEGSGLVDLFLTTPFLGRGETITLEHLLAEVLDLIGREFERRQRGEIPIPPLNSPGWAQSMGDLQSLELWIKWLPRYALYTQENPIIIGRTGTGKTNLAKAIHRLSGRTGDFVSMTPRDFSSSELVQAELFGAVAGAYTGAVDKWGLVRAAEGGTLFFDEFQSIDLDLQGKLITFIENKTYRRVGSPEHTKADVRFVFASNRKLFELVSEELVREDFAYRLERVMLQLHSLSERPYDIAPALAFGLAKLHRQRSMSRPVTGLTRSAYSMLMNMKWPGNLRQLENLIAKSCERVDMEDLSLIDEEVLRSILSNNQDQDLEDQHPIPKGLEEVLQLERSKGAHSLSETVSELRTAVRRLALQDTGGDALAASELINDDETSLQLDIDGTSLRRSS